MRPQVLVGALACLLGIGGSATAQDYTGELGLITSKAAIVRAEGSKKSDLRTRLEVGSFVLVDKADEEKKWVHVVFRVERDGDPVWMDGWMQLKDLHARSRHGFSFERPTGDTTPVFKVKEPPPLVIETNPPKSGFSKDSPSRSEWEEDLSSELNSDDEWDLEAQKKAASSDELGIDELDNKKKKKK